MRGRYENRMAISRRVPLTPPLGVLEEDVGSDHDVLATGSVIGDGWVDAGSVERPARDGAVGDRVVTLEHRDLGGALSEETTLGHEIHISVLLDGTRLTPL